MSRKSCAALLRALSTITLMSALFAAPAGATVSVGFCRASIPVAISAPDARGSESVQSGDLAAGSLSCVGSLGPWLMGGQSGWSTVTGSVGTGKDPLDPAGAVLITGGQLRLWASAPRYAWFHPPMVTFVSILRLRVMADALIVTGSGFLIPTAKSPAANRFTVAGVAELTSPPARGTVTQGRHGLLKLEFVALEEKRR